MTDDEPLRLFVAASVPQRELERLREETRGLRERWPNARWTEIENQHLTLKFLGSTPADRVQDVIAACASVAEASEASDLTLAGLGVFPSRSRARVLWAGLDDPAQSLARIAGELDDRLGPLGYPAEKRRFTAHLTLARFREAVRIETLPGLPAGRPFPLEAFSLWRSHLSPRGARYEQLRIFAIAHPA